jgi:hypothetical protein
VLIEFTNVVDHFTDLPLGTRYVSPKNITEVYGIGDPGTGPQLATVINLVGGKQLRVAGTPREVVNKIRAEGGR